MKNCWTLFILEAAQSHPLNRFLQIIEQIYSVCQFLVPIVASLLTYVTFFNVVIVSHGC